MKKISVLAALFLFIFMLSGCGGSGGDAPVADAGADQQVVTGTSVTLDGSGSTYADNDQLTYKWEFVSRPSGSTATLSDAAAAKPTFTPDRSGKYVLSLTVNDSIVDRPADMVTVTAMSLPDTGQTGDYTNTFGEDSDYTINPPSYTATTTTVTDNNTVLMWQQTDDGKTYNWYQATGTVDATFNPNNIDVCGSLVLGTHTDWRLPTKMELMSIVDYGTYNPAIDTSFFPGTSSSVYWSSTTYAGSSSSAWYVGFYGGYVNGYYKSYYYNVRCVR